MGRNRVEVMYKSGDTYISKVGEIFLLVRFAGEIMHRYAWNPNVFLRFMPYAEPFEDVDGKITRTIQEKLDAGEFPHSKRDVL